jgi:hypothetical protein
MSPKSTKRRKKRKRVGAESRFYAEALMKEWGLDKQPAKFRREVKAVLMELHPEAQLLLRNEQRLQVEVIEGSVMGDLDVWAYFPMHKRRFQTHFHDLRPATRVLLVIGSRLFRKRKHVFIDKIAGETWTHGAPDLLRDHLGHALLYLRKPKARNECADAWREWKECCRPGKE